MRSGLFRSALTCLISVSAALGIAAFLFAWSGLYNVAASHPHFAVINWALDFGLRRSVETRSALTTAPVLDDPNLMKLGAGHFDGGCAPCHSAPGETGNPIVKSTLPQPPNLEDAASRWTPEQLFWIVKNGFKFTGMPAWVAQEREDEVWAVVAFLEALPNMEPRDYRRAAMGNAAPLNRTGGELAKYGAGTEAISQCARCHGVDNEPPTSNRVPKLAGQSRAYLEMTLRYFAAGLRQSGIMQPAAAALTEADAAELARYYAGLRPVQGAGATEQASPDQLERGRAIASSGAPESGVPPCLACHGGGSAATFPTLYGQYAAYLRNQLHLWRNGLRNRTAQGAIMAAVATRLTEEQITDVTAWFESVASPTPTPAPTPTRKGRRGRRP
jgi:cytochrome c553